MKVTAVFQCTRKEQLPHGTELAFMPPYNVDTKRGAAYDPAVDMQGERYRRVNEGWSKHTPSGALSMTVTNEAAVAQFEQGEYYLLTFERFEP